MKKLQLVLMSMVTSVSMFGQVYHFDTALQYDIINGAQYQNYSTLLLNSKDSSYYLDETRNSKSDFSSVHLIDYKNKRTHFFDDMDRKVEDEPMKYQNTRKWYSKNVNYRYDEIKIENLRENIYRIYLLRKGIVPKNNPVIDLEIVPVEKDWFILDYEGFSNEDRVKIKNALFNHLNNGIQTQNYMVKSLKLSINKSNGFESKLKQIDTIDKTLEIKKINIIN